ncbi:unnamed protein product [Gordionus sp. m RMFG-2023]
MLRNFENTTRLYVDRRLKIFLRYHATNQDFNLFLLLIRFSFDIIWPLLLVIIMVWVRKQNVELLVLGASECHFDSKALLSAGMFNFFQKFVCNFNNTCKTENIEDNFYTDIDSK